MSDSNFQRQRGTGPLHASTYFDEALYQHELQTLFLNGPRYVGHALSVPNVGDYCALAQEGEGRALLHTDQGIELVSNVCRHRQAVMLRGRGTLDAHGSARHIVCPVHRWTYAASGTQPVGTLIGAPHFVQDPCLNLKRYPLQQWNGLLFEAGGRAMAADLAKLAGCDALDFSGYVLDRVELHTCHYNWKTFIEVYLEDYHVGPFHPGLGHFVSCDNLHWDFAQNASVQTVGVSRAFAFGQPGSPVYRRWHDALLAYQGGQLPERGAVWLTSYPHLMIEWYPHVLTVSSLHPQGPRQTLNMVAFFYPEEVAAFERELVQAQQAAYMETCREDDDIGERMDAGRKALLDRGDDEAGPYQHPLEDGMRHFHHWYRHQMNQNL